VFPLSLIATAGARDIDCSSHRTVDALVLAFAREVAKWLLPYFVGRVVTLQRFPDRDRGKAFYEKDAPKYTPACVHTTDVPGQAGGTPIT